MDDSMHTKSSKFRGNKLPVHGNERTMNLNHLILANITESAYFRTDLVQHRGWEDMVDEIYYRVQHLEAWEKVQNFHFFFSNLTNIPRDPEKPSRAVLRAASGDWPTLRYRVCRTMLACGALVKVRTEFCKKRTLNGTFEHFFLNKLVVRYCCMFHLNCSLTRYKIIMTYFRRHCVNAILLLVQTLDNEDEPSSSDENVESHRLALHSRRRLPLLALFAAARVPVAIFRGLSRG